MNDRLRRAVLKTRKGTSGRRYHHQRVGIMVWLAAAILASTMVLAVDAPQASAAVSSEVLADGPVAYWPLDETSGSTAHDAGPNGIDGSIVGGVTLGVPGPGGVGSAMDFNGSTGFVSMGAPAALQANSWSLETWVRFDTLPTAPPYDAYIYRNRFYGHGLVLLSDGRFSIYSHPEGGLNTPTSYTAGVWYWSALRIPDSGSD